MRNESFDTDLHEISDAVNADKISISDLLKSSYKLIRMDIMRLIAMVIFLQFISTTHSLFFKYLQRECFSAGYLFLYSPISLIISPLFFLIPVVALFEVYDKGQFSFKSVLATAYKKFLKFLWTSTLPAFYVLLILFSCVILYGFISILFGIQTIFLFYFLFFIPLVVLLIWAFVPLYFLEYVVICSTHYGLTAIKISFELVRGRKWQLFGYIVVISLITWIIAIPNMILLLKGYTISYFLTVPVSIVALFGISYGLLLYKHLISNVSESSINSSFTEKEKYKRKLCKHCLSKLDVAIKICPSCGTELSEADIVVL